MAKNKVMKCPHCKNKLKPIIDRGDNPEDYSYEELIYIQSIYNIGGKIPCNIDDVDKTVAEIENET